MNTMIPICTTYGALGDYAIETFGKRGQGSSVIPMTVAFGQQQQQQQ